MSVLFLSDLSLSSVFSTLQMIVTEKQHHRVGQLWIMWAEVKSALSVQPRTHKKKFGQFHFLIGFYIRFKLELRRIEMNLCQCTVYTVNNINVILSCW